MKKLKRGLTYFIATVLLAEIIFVGNNQIEVKGSVKAAIPETNAQMDSIGATMPYTRYDSTAAVIGGGAALVSSKDFAKDNIASQASEQSYIKLPVKGSYAEWRMNTSGDGVTIRFTLPDSRDGMGQSGSLDIYVNNKKVKTLDLTSYYMWQYFPDPASNPAGHPKDTPEGTGCFAFDETHFRLNTSLKKGDKIKIVSTGANNLEYGVDFLEIEQVPAEIKKPDGAYSITDYGADGTDEYDDYGAIQKCITAAKKDGKDVYIPAGTFRIGQIWKLDASDIKITGAGIWYTNIQFTNSAAGKGGISGSTANNVEFCNMYINSMLRSRYDQNAVYKCFMDVWSGGSYIHDIWEDHFECGFWMADYVSPIEYSDGLVIYNSRIRNNLADGVNFCQGTSNATVYNCSIRNNGDDGLAMWSNNYLSAKNETNNVFCYNTIDFIWRAGGIAIYGGNGHKIYNNYISDTFMASGIHLNTVFDGYKFTYNSGMEFTNNIIVRSGTSSDSWNSNMGAIDISGDVKNVTFNNTYIYDAQHDGIRIFDSPSNLIFNQLSVFGCGIDGNTTDSSDSGAVIKYEKKNTTKSVTYNGIQYANCPYDSVIFGSRILSTFSDEINYGNNYKYSIPMGTNVVITAPVPEETTYNNSQNTTSNVENNTSKITVGKTKVKKVVKKRASKKAKITLKKVKGAAGYQVKVSVNKKFKKSKTITKIVKKVKFTIKSRKIKGAKKLYVKARAYKNISGKKCYGSWSKKKIIKV